MPGGPASSLQPAPTSRPLAPGVVPAAAVAAEAGTAAGTAAAAVAGTAEAVAAEAAAAADTAVAAEAAVAEAAAEAATAEAEEAEAASLCLKVLHSSFSSASSWPPQAALPEKQIGPKLCANCHKLCTNLLWEPKLAAKREFPFE